jgi:tetratricopeptide (TPR) repeat protein
MTPKRSKPRWTVYEQQVFELFKQYFPNAKVRKNVRVKGRFSKRKRQIDILVTENTPAGTLRTIVDTKFFKRKVDVKVVEGLEGFVSDVGAQKGMLITSLGYTRAALRRAFYGPSNLELDILNFSELQRFQGFTAIPYAGEKAFLVAAPFGWVVDATRTESRLANMYQRGLDVTSAMRKKEFLYINFWNRKADPLTAAELDEHQVAQMRLYGPVAVSRRDTVQRTDAVTRLRIADVKEYKCLEVTGFLQFDDVIFFAVLLTPTETQRPNIRRLESVLRQAVPIELRRDNSALIVNLREQIKSAQSVSERARLLRELGHWYRDSSQFDDARQALEESLALDPYGSAGYHTMKELLQVLCNLDDRDRAREVMSLLLRLDPHNPTVFNDCFRIGADWIERNDFLKMLDILKGERPDDQFIAANCDFYAGNLLICDDLASAKRRFIAARQTFRRMLPRSHQVFRALQIVLKRCS